MVYKNHIYANVEAYDDSPANVYAIVLADPVTFDEASIRNYIITHQDTFAHVYRLTQTGLEHGLGLVNGYLDPSTFVHMNLMKHVTVMEPPSQFELDVETDYKVYFMAIDDFDNRSNLEISSAGRINRRAPPTVSVTSDQVGMSGATVHYEISSDVYFRYKMIVLSYSVADMGKVKNLFDNAGYVHQGVISSGFDALGTRATTNATNYNFSHVYQNVDKATDFDLAIESDRAYYVHFILENTDLEHNTSTLVSYPISPTIEPSLPVLTFTTYRLPTIYDQGVKLDFIVNNNNSNVDIYMQTFSTKYEDYTVNGLLKNKIFTAPPVTANIETNRCEVELSTYYVDIDGVNVMSMDHGVTYYTYMRARDRVTGKMSAMHEFEYTTGKEPINTINIAHRAVDEANVSGSIIYEQSSTDVYMAIIHGVYPENDIIGYLLGNTDSSARNTYGLTDTPDARVVKRSALPVVDGTIVLENVHFMEYNNNIYDTNDYNQLNALVDANVYMYTIDANGYANITYTSLPPPDGVDVSTLSSRFIAPVLTSVANLDTSFVVRCPNATTENKHYTMAFDDDVIHENLLTSGELKLNIQAYGEEIVTDQEVEIATKFNRYGNIMGGIEPHGTYNIYTLAKDTVTGVLYHDDTQSVLFGLTAEHPPELRNLTVDFNTGSPVV